MADTGHLERQVETTETLKAIVKNTISSEVICSIAPRKVMENKAFLVDTSKLGHVDDILADDCGIWLNNGKSKQCYQYLDGDFKKFVKSSTLPACTVYFTSHITYYVNKNSKDFRRKISFVTGN